MIRFTIDKESDAPLYAQLADAIRLMVASGELKPGDKLPTVRALFEETGLSDGTIRHAYELLAREGVLELTRGRGTFVLSPRGDRQSREKRAMEAINTMLDALTALNFSSREIEMFLEVVLAQRAEDRQLTPVAIVDCNSEALNEAARQLSVIPGVELTEYLLDDIRRSPVELLKGFPLIVTTHTHAHEMSLLLGDLAPRIGRVVLSPSPHTIAALSRLEAPARVGIYCRSARFSQIVKSGLRLFPQLRPNDVTVCLAGEGSARDFAADRDALIVSPDYLSYATEADCEALGAFAEGGGSIIPYHHQIDQGSLLYIEERIYAL